MIKINFHNKHSHVIYRLCELALAVPEAPLEHFTSCTYLLQYIPEVSIIYPSDIYADLDSQFSDECFYNKINMSQDHI